ncbi:TPA: hypothetical protein ACJK1P_004106 [Salmonella enterica subsp. diarizonae serovar 38:(k):z35]
MTRIVNSWNDFDPLKHVIVGVADHSCIPPEEPATSEKVPIDSPMRGQWGPRPTETVEKANAQLNNLVKVLEKEGVKVDRPTPLNWSQPVMTPDFRTASMMTCMPPRDTLLTIGNEIIEAAMSFRCRYWEYLAFRPLLSEYFDKDPDFLWT